WLLAPLGVRVAWAVGWLDQPAARKLHTTATAMLGGAVVFVAAIATWLLLLGVGPHSTPRRGARYPLAGAALTPRRAPRGGREPLRRGTKMLGQAAAATMLIAGGLVPDLGLPVGIEAALTLVALVALMNAVNFLDNMNGMIGGLAAIALGGFAWTALERGA